LVIGACIFPNWESHTEFDMSFMKNDTEKYSSYYAVNADNLSVAQTNGDSSCKYLFKWNKRVSPNTYVDLTNGVPRSFASNNDSEGICYNLTGCWWNDVRFKVDKKAGFTEASTLKFSLGQKKD